MADQEPDTPAGGDASQSGSAATKPKRKKKPAPEKDAQKTPPKPLPPFNVVLLNDDDHSYDYVIEMLQKLFGHPPERGYQLAKVVDTDGRAIVYTTHKELAELKRDQIHGYGIDVRIAKCSGSMKAFIEPAE
jgi:ATP-dependent Clp protease adaptor protein ClpS